MDVGESSTFRGSVRFLGSVTLPDAVVGDAECTASDPIGCTKLDHQYAPTVRQPDGSAAATRTEHIHLAYAAGTVTAFRASLATACVGDSTVTFDLHKNGASILTSPVSFSSADAADDVKSATLSGTTYVADDVFEVVVTATAGTGTLGQGPCGQLIVREEAGA